MKTEIEREDLLLYMKPTLKTICLVLDIDYFPTEGR